MNTLAAPMPAMQAVVHDMDRVRIERALRQRVRYRYVQPQVARSAAAPGWVVSSPCCSRNIDPSGGVISIAWLEPAEGMWSLYFRDHVHDRWILHDECHHLQPLLDEVCLDPTRVFWP